MFFSDAVVKDLAQTWTRLHGSAAQHHLECMIHELELAGDAQGVANYRRILASVMASEGMTAQRSTRRA